MTQRPIKFRAWDKDRKQMFYGFELVGPRPHLHAMLSSQVMWNLDEYFAQLQKVYALMQFTGLHDKNGKEIWESDRVEYGPFDQGIVEWRDAGFVIRRIGDDEIAPLPNGSGVITGNIYEGK